MTNAAEEVEGVDDWRLRSAYLVTEEVASYQGAEAAWDAAMKKAKLVPMYLGVWGSPRFLGWPVANTTEDREADGQ